LRRYLPWLILLTLVIAIAWKLAVNKRALEGRTQLSSLARAFVPVSVVQPLRDTLASRLEADGIFLPSKEMFVLSETQGRIVEVYKNKGEWVREGEVIARADDELLRTELAATRANLAKLRLDRERLQRLIAGEAVPKSKIEEVQLGIVAAEAKEKVLLKQIANTRIKAPMTGTLGLRFIERGSVIGPGIQVAQMTNLDELFLMVKVAERDVLSLRKGLDVDVHADVLPGQPLRGRITNIGLRADNTFNYDVEITVKNPTGNPLRGGMHARASFAFDTQRAGLTLPRKAIGGSLEEASVFVVIADTLAQRRTVTLGGTYGDRVEVLSGVTEQDRVVIGGQLNLSDGVRVEIVEQ
jgi:membrane fusion protein (multidrug efflux system)